MLPIPVNMLILRSARHLAAGKKLAAQYDKLIKTGPSSAITNLDRFPSLKQWPSNRQYENDSFRSVVQSESVSVEGGAEKTSKESLSIQRQILPHLGKLRRPNSEILPDIL